MKWVCKVSHHGPQFRITIPRKLVESLGWDDANWVILCEESPGSVTIRRFIVEKALKLQTDSSGSKIN